MRIGMIGAGNIVKTALDAISQIDGVTCEAVFVRKTSFERGKKLCEKYGINTLYTDYQKMLTDTNIDFIYIGIPNNMHYEYAVFALTVNKHVICEKPFTTNVDELVKLKKMATEKELFLFEAITNIHAPNIQILKDTLQHIGPVRFVRGNYSQLSSRYARYLEGDIHPVFDPESSGGALYDINIYNIHLCCYLFGKPEQVQYTLNRGYNGIDTSGVMVMQYPEFIAVCTGAKDSESDGHFVVQGVNGFITIQGIPSVAASVEVNIGGHKQVFNQQHTDNHMVYEFKHFHQIFITKALNECYRYLDHSIEVMKVLEAGKGQ